jgi:hypothetical protein
MITKSEKLILANRIEKTIHEYLCEEVVCPTNTQMEMIALKVMDFTDIIEKELSTFEVPNHHSSNVVWEGEK